LSVHSSTTEDSGILEYDVMSRPFQGKNATCSFTAMHTTHPETQCHIPEGQNPQEISTTDMVQ